MVQISPLITNARSPTIIALCTTVTVTPEDNKITVFNKGNPQASKVIIPLGGKAKPTPIAGAKLQWKKPQKKLKKNISSETINNIIPKRIPCCTLKVCWPS